MHTQRVKQFTSIQLKSRLHSVSGTDQNECLHIRRLWNQRSEFKGKSSSKEKQLWLLLIAKYFHQSNILDNLHSHDTSQSKFESAGLELGRVWLRLADFACNIKYVRMRSNPMLNKSQLVGCCWGAICDVWGTKEDAGSLAAGPATPWVCCSSGIISFTLLGHWLFLLLSLCHQGRPAHFCENTYNWTVSQESHFEKVLLLTTAIEVQPKWKGSGTVQRNITCKQISVSGTPCLQI